MPGSSLADRIEQLAEGREPGDVTTLRDASVLDALRQATSEKGSTR